MGDDTHRVATEIATIQAKIESQGSEIERLRGHVTKMYSRDEKMAVLEAKMKWLWAGITGASGTGIGALASQFLGGP